jgi:deoxyribodipyrimidine photolyase-related protein
MQQVEEIRLILGDQLNHSHGWFQKKDKNTLYIMMEVASESYYVKHHIQKIVAFFAAMRKFSDELKLEGHQVHYISISDKSNQGDFFQNMERLIEKFQPQKLTIQEPDEYRLQKEFETWEEKFKIPVSIVSSEHFYTSRSYLAEFFKGNKTYLMERFYRALRERESVLMNKGIPEGWEWNYDQSNRKKWKGNPSIPAALFFEKDVSGILKEIHEANLSYFGEIEPYKFPWPTSRKESAELLKYFIDNLLTHFGDYQDAMHQSEHFLFHSRLSFAMNVKMLSPKEVVKAVEKAYRENQEKYPLNAVEGFIRQILGWREFVRGIYWARMPEYSKTNALNHSRPLPNFYWDGNTNMACVKSALNNSLRNAYAHHIQRLMVLGNLALLLGCNPDEVDKWYLGVYIDAIEWVEMPNTRGMSQFADGGLLATKPYVSSANYIHKMSNHCVNCAYDYKSKTGSNPCPFNVLYWDFLDRHEDKFRKNPRTAMIYRNLDRMDPNQKAQILNKANEYKLKFTEG